MESRFIAGPAGPLDSRWHGSPTAPPVLLLHPHPRMGGTMGSRLVYDLAEGLAAAGFLAVRFDFRGVGRSAGAYGDGLGETDDAAAMLDAVAAATGREPIVIGYSFGGAVALHLATRRPLGHVVLVATPTRMIEAALRPLADAPKARIASCAVVAGDRDDLVTPDESRELAATLSPSARLVLLKGAGHFLEPSQNGRALSAVLLAIGHLAQTDAAGEAP